MVRFHFHNPSVKCGLGRFGCHFALFSRFSLSVFSRGLINYQRSRIQNSVIPCNAETTKRGHKSPRWDDFKIRIAWFHRPWDDLWDDFDPLGRFHFPNPSVNQALGRFGAELDPGCLRWSRTAFDDAEALCPCAGLKPIQSEFQGEFQTEILPISKQFKAIQTKNFNCQSLAVRSIRQLGPDQN